MKKILIYLLLIMLSITTSCQFNYESGDDKSKETTNDNKDYVETIVEPKVYNDGIYTVSQSSGDYSASLALPSDDMMVFANGYDRVKSQVQNWIKNSSYKQIDIFIPLGRDFNSYYVSGKYDKKEHKDIIQTFSNGTYYKHPTGDTYYTFPSSGFVDFLVDYACLALDGGAKDVYLEEPDGFTNAVYCDFIKSEYKKRYGVDFSDPEKDDTVRYQVDKMVADILTEAMDSFSTKLKKRYPNAKVYICTHTSQAYCINPITSNNYDIINCKNVDGVICQSWTDTQKGLKVGSVNGRVERPFEVAYSEYSELLTACYDNDKKYYSLSDPASDGGYDMAITRQIYQQGVIAQMLQPNINAFQISIWPDRSFGNADIDYKRTQQVVFAAMQESSKEKVVRQSGSTGFGILMSYNCVSNSNYQNIVDYVQSINIPLLEEGIPTEVILLEGLTEKLLSRYKVIFLSYNFIKPEEVLQNQLLSKFVQNGGTIVYVDGGNNRKNLKSFWANSPEGDLFNKMNLEYSLLQIGNGNKLVNCFEDGKDINIGETNLHSVYFGDNDEPIFKSGNSNVVVKNTYGNGNVIGVGISPLELLTDSGKDLIKYVAKYAYTFAGEKYISTGYLMTTRGQYIAIKAYDKELNLSGTYVDLFDSGLTIIKNPKIEKNSYRLLKKLPKDGNNRVFVANCADVNFEEIDDELTFTTKTIYSSETVALVSMPYVNPKSISVIDSITKENISFTQSFDEINRVLKLTYTQTTKNKIDVKIKFEY